MKRNELILLVGRKSAGKSTYIQRFFANVLPQDIRADCVVIRIDLANSGNPSDVTKWLDEHFLEVAESATFPQGPPSYDEIQGMYFSEYKRWAEGHARPLYESNKNQFKIDFGKHIETQRRDRPHEYIKHLLFRIVQGHSKVPCLVFDNADHFSVKFQEDVFNYAQSLYADSLCLVLLPITDTTSWQLPKQGPLQSFLTDSYFLPSPPTELVLRKRIEFIEKKVAEELESSGKKKETGRGYFFSRGMRLDIENIEGFAIGLQTVFINTGQVAEWIGRLANHDIRRSLQLAREIVASPHIGVAELYAARVDRSANAVNVEDVKTAIIRGRYDIYYHTVQSFVQNVFNLCAEFETSPLLPVRILQCLDSARQGNEDNDHRYVVVRTLTDYFSDMNIDSRTTLACLDELLKLGLCLGYDPTKAGADGTEKVEIAPSGQQHLAWGLHDWVYLEAMAEVTPMYDRPACEAIRECLRSAKPHKRREAIAHFINYLLAEDKHFCVIPQHDNFSPQQRVRTSLSNQLTALSSVGSLTASTRYKREIGRIVNWNQSRGFGLIRREDGSNVFAHVTALVDSAQAPSNGDAVEFSVVRGQQRDEAAEVVVLN